MVQNVCGVDRVLRGAAGAGLMLAAATGALGAWAWIGAVPLLTAVAGTCPAYSLLGTSTCRTRSN